MKHLTEFRKCLESERAQLEEEKKEKFNSLEKKRIRQSCAEKKTRTRGYANPETIWSRVDGTR